MCVLGGGGGRETRGGVEKKKGGGGGYREKNEREHKTGLLFTPNSRGQG